MHTGRDTLDDDLFRCRLTPLIPYDYDLTYVGEADVHSTLILCDTVEIYECKRLVF